MTSAETTPAAWMAQAACADTDPAVFFPPPGVVAREALALCAGCVVRSECLTYALDTGERYGIWGGLNARERDRLRSRPVGRRPRPIDHGTEAGYHAHRRRGEAPCWSCTEGKSQATARRHEDARWVAS